MGSERAGVRMYKMLNAHLALFSNKQRKFLERECKLAEKFRDAALQSANEKTSSRRKSSSSGSSASPDGGGRQSKPASLRGEIIRVWERISNLPAAERQAACD